MNCYIEVHGEGTDAKCSIRYEHDLMSHGDKTNARVEAMHRVNEVVQLLYGYPELQEKAKQLRAEIVDIVKHPMP